MSDFVPNGKSGDVFLFQIFPELVAIISFFDRFDRFTDSCLMPSASSLNFIFDQFDRFTNRKNRTK